MAVEHPLPSPDKRVMAEADAAVVKAEAANAQADLSSSEALNAHLKLEIEKLRRELYVAETKLAAEGLPAQLGVSKAEVEVQFAVERTKEGGGGIKFNVISVGGKASKSATATHRLLLSLTPLQPGDTRPGVAGGGEGYESRPPGRHEEIRHDKK